MDELEKLPYLCGVMPDRHLKGMDDLSQWSSERRPQALTCLPPLKAFSTAWPTDAHFVTYYVQGQDGQVEDQWPRLNKDGAPIVQQLRMHGGDVRSWCFVFDWDCKSLYTDLPKGTKIPLDPPHLAAFLELFEALPEETRAWADRVTYFYGTKNGVRIVYVLKNSLPVERGEALHKVLVHQLRAGGLMVDELSAWNHLFRLPRTMRVDILPTGERVEQECVPLEEVWQDTLFDPVAFVGEQALQVPVVSPKKLDYPKPSDDEVLLVLGTDKRRPEWWKDVKLGLRFANCYSTVYEDRLIAESQRNNTIQSYVGEIVHALGKCKRKRMAVGPTQIYALLHSAVLQLEPDEQDPDWTDTLWKACLNYWAKELSKIEEEQVTHETNVLVAQSLQDRVLKGMREWCNAPELRADDSLAVEFASQHYLVTSPAGVYYVINQDGYYDSVPVRDRLIPAKVRELGIEPLIPLGRLTDKGYKRYLLGELVDRHATVVQAVEGHASGGGNWVRNLRGEWPTLCLRLYRRREDLEGLYDPEVDAWLKQLGGEDYSRLCAWIGHALAFDEGPIAALALCGSGGVGKKLIALGLAECVGSEVYADSGDMGKYAENLLKSPVMVINEGLRKNDRSGGYDPADIFRIFTGGDPLKIETKFRDRIEVRAPVRVIVTANNTDVISMLAGTGRNLSQDDKEALAQRIVIVRVGRGAKAWLRLQGGIDFTRGWVSRDSGGGSSYRVARHFMHLYETRPKVAHGSRFLVEGNAEDHVVQTLNTRSGQAPVVVEALVAMIEAARLRPVEGMHLQLEPLDSVAGVPGCLPRVWVTAHSIPKWLSTIDKKPVLGTPRQGEVIKVFRGLARAGEPEGGRLLVFSSHGKAHRAQWFNLDLHALLGEAYEFGYPCNALEALVTELETKEEAEPLRESGT